MVNNVHCNKILTIQQGYPRGVSSAGKPRPTSTWISSVSIYRVYLGEWPIKPLLSGQVHVHVDAEEIPVEGINNYFLLQTTEVS